MAQIFSFVLQATLYGTIVGLAILALKVLLYNRLNARWHYLLWIVLLIKLVFPFGPESTLSIFNVVPDLPTPQPAPVVTSPHLPTPSLGGNTPTPIPPSHPDQVSNSPSPAYPSPMEVGSVTWVFGSVLLAGWLLSSLLVFGVKLKKRTLEPTARVLEITKRAKARIGVSKEVNVVVSEIVSTPSLFGLLKPSILLPSTLCNLSDQDLEYVILHELAHLKRKDILVNYLLLFIQTIHWFNPIIWYLFRCMRRDMEVATDEAVLAAIESTEHKQYGMTLITVLASFSEPRLATKLLCMADNKSDIERRIKMIKMAGFFRKRTKLVFTIGALCIVLLSGALLTSGISGSAPEELNFDQVGVMVPGESQPKLTLTSPEDISTIKQALEHRIKVSTSDERLKLLPDYYLELYKGTEKFDTVSLWLALGEQALVIFESNPQSVYMLSYLETNLVASLVDPLEGPGDQAHKPELLDLSEYLYTPERWRLSLNEMDILSDSINVGSLLGYDNVMKLVLPEGATVNQIIYFVYDGQAPILITGIYATESWEVDVNGDGKREVVYAFGSPGPNIRIIFSNNLEADLNSVVKAPSVQYLPNDNQFLVNHSFDERDYIYQFDAGTPVLRRIN